MTSLAATEMDQDEALDPAIQLWLRLGRGAFFFCIWSAMAIPVALTYYARF